MVMYLNIIRSANIRFIYILANKPQLFFIIFPAVPYQPLEQEDNKYRAKLGGKLKYYVPGNYIRTAHRSEPHGIIAHNQHISHKPAETGGAFSGHHCARRVPARPTPSRMPVRLPARARRHPACSPPHGRRRGRHPRPARVRAPIPGEELSGTPLQAVPEAIYAPEPRIISRRPNKRPVFAFDNKITNFAN